MYKISYYLNNTYMLINIFRRLLRVQYIIMIPPISIVCTPMHMVVMDPAVAETVVVTTVHRVVVAEVAAAEAVVRHSVNYDAGATGDDGDAALLASDSLRPFDASN